LIFIYLIRQIPAMTNTTNVMSGQSAPTEDKAKTPPLLGTIAGCGTGADWTGVGKISGCGGGISDGFGAGSPIEELSDSDSPSPESPPLSAPATPPCLLHVPDPVEVLHVPSAHWDRAAGSLQSTMSDLGRFSGSRPGNGWMGAARAGTSRNNKSEMTKNSKRSVRVFMVGDPIFG